MKELIEQFALELKTVRSARANTVIAYQRAVVAFSEWLSPKTLIEAERNDFIRWRQEQTVSQASLKIFVVALRSFYDWMTESRRLAINPFPDMVVRVVHQDPTNVPTSAQFLKLRLLVQHDPETSALVELLAGSGLRIDAAMSLRPDQIVMREEEPSSGGSWATPSCIPLSEYGPPNKAMDYIKIDPEHCKGRVASVAFLTPCARRALHRWMSLNRPSEDAPVFGFTYRTADRRVHNAGLKVGLDISPHSLRHLFGCLMYHRNIDGGEHDLIWVRDALSHSNVSVTDTYLKLARTTVVEDGDWHEIIWRWHPPADEKSEQKQRMLFEDVA